VFNLLQPAETSFDYKKGN